MIRHLIITLFGLAVIIFTALIVEHNLYATESPLEDTGSGFGSRVIHLSSVACCLIWILFRIVHCKKYRAL